VINEATTVAAAYGLSYFMADVQHVGSNKASPAGMDAAFATAKDLVDITTGLARTNTVSGRGTVPQTKINALANLLSSCAKTAGSTQGDGSVCDQLFHSTNPGDNPAMQAANTAQALLDLVRNATGFSNNLDSFAALYRLAATNRSYEPTVDAEPSDWTLAIQFPNEQGSPDVVSLEALSTDNTNRLVDAGGNVWTHDNGKITTEFVGGASCVGLSNALIPIEASAGSTP